MNHKFCPKCNACMNAEARAVKGSLCYSCFMYRSRLGFAITFLISAMFSWMISILWAFKAGLTIGFPSYIVFLILSIELLMRSIVFFKECMKSKNIPIENSWDWVPCCYCMHKGPHTKIDCEIGSIHNS